METFGEELPWLSQGFNLYEMMHPERNCGKEHGEAVLLCVQCRFETNEALLQCEHELCGKYYHELCLNKAIREIKKDENLNEVPVFCPSCHAREQSNRKRLLDVGVDVGSENVIFSLPVCEEKGKKVRRKIVSILNGKCCEDEKPMRPEQQVEYLQNHMKTPVL